MGYGVSVLQHETYTFNSNISVYSYKLKKHWTGNIWYDKLRETGTAAHDKQTWRVLESGEWRVFAFESTYWSKGNYLLGPEKVGKSDMEFLWCDDVSGGLKTHWWRVRPSSL